MQDLSSAQHTTPVAGCAGHYALPVVTTHGPVTVQCYQDRSGAWAYAVPSRSRPGAVHIVTITRNLFPLRGTCDCPTRATCWHVVAANEAANFVGETLYLIATLQRPGCSADDWHHGAMLLARLTAAPAPQATHNEVAA